jgi:hypothetical protein
MPLISRKHAIVAVVLAACACIGCALGAAPAEAGSLQPQGNKILFGTSDTGNSADFGSFSVALHKHPALIESFRSWGSDFPDSITRWQAARARPVLHITTADSGDGHEIITPRGIAQGEGDEYLLRLNKLFWAKKMRAYVRPLGEPNRCINVYASYDCAGGSRGSGHSPSWYRRAFRRIYILLHGGGKRGRIDARLAAAGLPPLAPDVRGLPRAPVAVLWSVLPAGSPTVPQNRPRHFYPGDKYVDWVGTDFYSDNQDWKSLTGLYRRFSPKPFAIPEFGVSSGDDPRYMQHLLTWVKRHDRCKMLVYYQDFGSSSPYRIQNYPASLAVLDKRIHTKRFPAFAPGHPKPPPKPPPPPGGIGPHGPKN